MPKQSDPEHEGAKSKLFRIRPKSEGKVFNEREILLAAPAIAALIRLVVSKGDALSFSLTSDGGQLCITRLHDREPSKVYIPKEASITEALIALAEEYGADYVQLLQVALTALESAQPQLPFA